MHRRLISGFLVSWGIAGALAFVPPGREAKMPGRGYKVEVIPLTVDSTAQPVLKDVSHRHVFVADMPPAGVGLVKLSLDRGDMIPVSPGMRFTACVGDVYQQLAVAAPIVGGNLTLLLSNDELVPSAGGGAAASALNGIEERHVDALWVPWGSSPDNAALPTSWADRLGGIRTAPDHPAFFTAEVAGLGVAPAVFRERERRLGKCKPGGGQSSARFAMTDLAWKRMRTGQHSTRDRAVQAWAFETLLARNGAGGVKDADHGLVIEGSDGTAMYLPTSGGGFLGIVGDGAGGWQLAARAVDQGPLTVQQAIAWPAPSLTDLVRVAIVLVDADPKAGRDGIVRFYVDDQLALEVTDMAKMPALTTTKANATAYGLALMDSGADAQALTFGDCHFVTGRAALALQS